MIVLVPYIPGMLRTATMDAVTTSALPVTWVRLDWADSTDYARQLRTFWESDRDFVIVEQDVVPSPHQLTELVDCPEGWCAYPYDIGGHDTVASFGCTKFTAAFRRSYPDSAPNIFGGEGSGRDFRSWSQLDAFAHQHLTARGARCHLHHPAVIHLHRYERGA